MRFLRHYFGARSLVLLAASISLPLCAGTVTLTTVGGRSFASRTGSPLPGGCLIRVGTFDLPSGTRDEMITSTRDYLQLRSWFRPLAEGLAGAGTTMQALVSDNALRTNNFPAAGQTFGTVSGISTSYLSPGTRLYVWVFDAPSAEQANEWGIFTAESWAAPPALGGQSVSTSTDVRPLHGAQDGTSLKLAAIPVSYANWAWKRFPGSIPSGQMSIAADADGDGLHNLAEYAWGLNPQAVDKPRYILSRNGSSGARFSFDVPLQRPDVKVVAECSTDLKTWLPAPSVVTAENVEYETRTSSTNGAKCYWRVKITQSDP